MPTYSAVLLIVAGVIALSVAAGSDAGWDFRNYHLYNPYALFHKAPGTDLYPAQLQTFHAPTVDLVPFLLYERLNDHPKLLSAILGLREAAAAVMAFGLGLLLLPIPKDRTDRLVGPAVLLITLLIGVTGAAGLPVISGSMGEMPETALLLAALWILARAVGRGGSPLRTYAMAGLCLGMAIGLKLTVLPFVVASGVAVLMWLPGPIAMRLKATGALGVSAGIGACAVGGYWWVHLYRVYGNPIFPYYNNLFRSSLYKPVAFRDDIRVPNSLGDAFSLPFEWGFRVNTLVIELYTRDPRIAIGLVACAAVLALAVIQGLRRRTVYGRLDYFFLTFFLLSFALWEAQFSILRYLVPLELMAFFPVLLALKPLLARRSGRLLALGIVAASVYPLLLYTVLPDWGRAVPATTAATVSRQSLPSEGMVLLLTDDPMAYLAAFAPPQLRFVGVNSNIIRPGDTTGLAKQVETAVRAYDGPLWGLDIPDATGRADTALRFYGLARGPGCHPVDSNLDGSAIRLCPLIRTPS